LPGAEAHGGDAGACLEGEVCWEGHFALLEGCDDKTDLYRKEFQSIHGCLRTCTDTR
jgi:hypothetical protein